MKAIVIDQFGGPEVLVDRTLPLPTLSRDQVRVKVKAIGFNPVDVKMRCGIYGGSCPQILGVDFSGIVDAVGDQHGEFSVGDAVFGVSSQHSSNGSYAEYISVPTEVIAKMPKHLSFEQAAAVPVTYLTAFQAIVGTGALQQNRPLFISGGSGGVGSAAIALAKVYRAGPVFTMTGSTQSRDYLIRHLQVPSSRILDYSGMGVDEMARKLIEMNGHESFYFALDFVGGKIKQLCLDIVAYNGHMATILPEDETFPVQLWGRESIFWHKSLSFHMIYLFAALEGDHKAWNIYKSQLKHLASLFEKGELLEPHIENVGSFSAETTKKAHNRLESGGNIGKLVMTVSDSN